MRHIIITALFLLIALSASSQSNRIYWWQMKWAPTGAIFLPASNPEDGQVGMYHIDSLGIVTQSALNDSIASLRTSIRDSISAGYGIDYNSSTGNIQVDTNEIATQYDLTQVNLDLQDVTDNGNETTNDIIVNASVGIGVAVPENELDVDGSIYIRDIDPFYGLTSYGKLPIFSYPIGDDAFIGPRTGNLSLSDTPGGTSGARNIGVGNSVLYNLTTGHRNLGVGYSVMSSLTTGSYNTIVGMASLDASTNSTNNSGLGHHVLRSTTSGSDNSAFGAFALEFNTTGANNTATGVQALSDNTIGIRNTANGHRSLYRNIDGFYNTAAGYFSLSENTSGYGGAAFGYSSLSNITTGSYNVGIGYEAGRFITDGSSANQTSESSIYLGGLSKALANGGSNEIVIGYNATGLGSNSVMLGNSNIVTTALRGNVGIGTTSPAVNLDVVGNSRITGTLGVNTTVDPNTAVHILGTSTTTGHPALLAENSSGQRILAAENDGYIKIGSAADSPAFTPITGSTPGIGGGGFGFVWRAVSGSRPNPAFSFTAANNISNTSSTGNFMLITPNFTPASGSTVLNMINLNPTINQTGGASGISRGLYISATLTSAADFRAIEILNGRSKLRDTEVQSTDAFYLGDANTDGTWRIIRSGNDLLSQRREGGSYVTKQTITP